MDMKLLHLAIDNFKGCQHQNLNFQGRSASIYGDNATGKTTIYDAFAWLLFGKDSRGRGDFEIKPLDPSGKVVDHAAVTAVEAILEVDGVPFQLRRAYYERWSVKRGGGQATYDGNTSEYFVDGVPMKKSEYENRIRELVSEDVFRVLTNVSWFCEGMDWRRRRDMLFQVCELPGDKDIMAANPRFEPLAAAMGGLSMEDYKRKIQAERKGLNASRNTIPARLDEQKKSIEALSGIDFPAIRARRDTTAAKLEQLQAELTKLGHGALLDAKRNELAAARNAIEAEINRNTSHRQSQTVPLEDRRPAIKSAMDKAAAEAARWRRMAAGEENTIGDLEAKIQACRDFWAVENARSFQTKNCPTCGQTLPEAALRAARDRFEADKKKSLQEAVDRANDAKSSLAAARGRREEYIQAAIGMESEAGRLRAELEAYQPEAQPEILDLTGHTERLAAAEEKARSLAAEVERLEGETAAIQAEIIARVGTLQAEVEALNGELAKEAMLTFARRRSDELREEARKAATALDEVDRMLFLCEEFARHKVRYVEDAINSRFQLIRWKLYDQQVNGGLADCCEATVNGVPYAALNNGGRINAGLDVIGALSSYYGVGVPLFIDNAESVTRLLPMDGQVIRLVVSNADKELRCEYGAQSKRSS